MLSHADLLDARLGELSSPNSGLQLYCKLERLLILKSKLRDASICSLDRLNASPASQAASIHWKSNYYYYITA